MSMTDWAKREIELACKHENPDWDGKEFDYGCACYQSALKAYESLMGDGHSGMSFGFTKNILIRLMEGLPLRPITDEDFFDNRGEIICLETEEDLRKRGLKSHTQCPRMSSLFREEALDGKITYSDINRYYCIDVHNPNISYANGTAKRIIGEMFPINMPYYPQKGKYKVYTEDFLTDVKNGDFDTKAFFYCITPEGEKVEINRFFAEKDHKWVEISKEEYEQRKLVKLYPFKDESNR